MKRKSKTKITYEPEADVLMWEISGKPINYAKEAGNVVVHFTKTNMPVLIEILEAGKFVSFADKLIGSRKRGVIKKLSLAAR